MRHTRSGDYLPYAKMGQQHPHTGRKNTKQAQVVVLLQRSSGATLQHLMRATGWQAHSVRGFISGALGKKLALPFSPLCKAPNCRRICL
jgi:hypothetical protein